MGRKMPFQRILSAYFSVRSIALSKEIKSRLEIYDETFKISDKQDR